MTNILAFSSFHFKFLLKLANIKIKSSYALDNLQNKLIYLKGSVVNSAAVGRDGDGCLIQSELCRVSV